MRGRVQTIMKPSARLSLPAANRRLEVRGLKQWVLIVSLGKVVADPFYSDDWAN